MKSLLFLFTSATLALSCSQTVTAETPRTDFFVLETTTLEGEAKALEDYRGKAVLVVNVASKCGYTPQYEGLQKMYERYADQGLVILAFPCNQFLGQEPGSADEIRAFCSDNYQVTFPLMAKVEVQEGEGQSPVYRWLGGKTKELPAWNFAKYLIAPDGEQVQFFGTRVAPSDPEFVAAVEAALPQS